MPSHVTVLLVDIERERKALNHVAGTQLHSSTSRSSLRAIVERYFNDVRPLLTDNTQPGLHIESVDRIMQELLTLCHKRGTVRKYKELLKQAKTYLISLDSRLVSASHGNGRVRTDIDTQIITTLRTLLPSASLSYEQALTDLGSEQRLSWRGPATDLREALREALDHLAPDEEVLAIPGYRQEPNSHGPTMKQKVRFILRSRGLSKAITATTEDAATSIDEALGSFVRSVYTRSSISTHTPTEKSEVQRILDLVRVVFCELLEIR